MTVLQALDRHYGRLADRGDVVPPGYSVEPIGVVIRLEADGTIRAIDTMLDEKGKKPQPRRVPKWFGRAGIGSTPYFLWDNTAYALGVSTKNAEKTARDHQAFKALHLGELEDETDPGLVALCRFLESWRPETFGEAGFTEAMQAWNVAFRFGDERALLHERPAAMAHVARLGESVVGGPEGFCLVSGERRALARLHPKIKGIRGTASAEVPLVSFNLAAFGSYGHEQGLNAPTSATTSFRYGAALNRLLDRAGSRNRLEIADTTVVFWADASDVGEAAAQAAEESFADAFLAPPPEQRAESQEDSATARLRDRLVDTKQGRPAGVRALEIVPGTRFCVLGLSPNAARISVRFWLEDRFEAFDVRLQQHRDDLRIDPSPWQRPPALQYLLLKTTALQEKFENIPHTLAGEMLRAVLGGGRYPRVLLAAAIMRLRAGDDPGSGWHAAVIRACLARDHRLSPDKEDAPVSLDRDNQNPAYQLGRLFAAMESAQRQALNSLNATIRDRYFGGASSSPATVFPTLMKNMQNHLGKLRKDGKGRWLEREIEEIVDKLPPELPRALLLEEQGRFVIGYYHQRRAHYAGKPANEAHTDDDQNDDHDAEEDNND